MKKNRLSILTLMVMLMLSAQSAWADTAYVKLTAPDESVSWIEIQGTIDGTDFEVFNNYDAAIDPYSTEGIIDLNEVWSDPDGKGTHYQVTSIGDWSFSSCWYLSEVLIPSSVTSIGSSAFSFCSRLTSVTLPDGLTSIGESAFSGCDELTSIIIPSSVTTIGGAAFASCDNLTSLVVASDNLVYDSRDNCNAIIETAANKLMVGCKNSTIPAGVTAIGKYAFSGCGLTSITISEGVNTIEESAFSGSGLTSITIPEGITTLGLYAFSGCQDLTSVSIPSSVSSTGMATFYQCPNLSSVTISEGVTSIGYGSFIYCTSLTSITIPSSVTSIEMEAFGGCGLTSITIPSSVTNIGMGAFEVCSDLATISVEEGNGVYDSRDACNAIIETATNTLLTGCMNSVIPETVTSIGDGAFFSCSGLTEITIPSSITSIGDRAFMGCENLAVINSEIEEPFEISEETFSNYDATLNIPDGTYDKYINVSSWNQFKNLKDTYLTVTVTDAGLATLYFGYPLSIPDDSNIEGVYYAYSIDWFDWANVGFINFNKINQKVIPANTGVVISAAPGTYTFFRSSDEGESISNNLLQGTLVETNVEDIEGTVLTLGHYYSSDGSYSGDDVAFCRYYGNYGWLEPNKAFLVLPASSEVKALGISFNDSSTGVESIESGKKETVIYDLTGRRYSSKGNLPEGMYIVNGKKVFVK